MAHAKMVTDQVELLLDPVVVLQLRVHAVALVAQLLDLKLTWTDVVPELVDLEMQNELKLLKLLNFLF